MDGSKLIKIKMDYRKKEKELRAIFYEKRTEYQEECKKEDWGSDVLNDKLLIYKTAEKAYLEEKEKNESIGNILARQNRREEKIMNDEAPSMEYGKYRTASTKGVVDEY